MNEEKTGQNERMQVIEWIISYPWQWEEIVNFAESGTKEMVDILKSLQSKGLYS